MNITQWGKHPQRCFWFAPVACFLWSSVSTGANLLTEPLAGDVSTRQFPCRGQLWQYGWSKHHESLANNKIPAWIEYLDRAPPPLSASQEAAQFLLKSAIVRNKLTLPPRFHEYRAILDENGKLQAIIERQVGPGEINLARLVTLSAVVEKDKSGIKDQTALTGAGVAAIALTLRESAKAGHNRGQGHIELWSLKPAGEFYRKRGFTGPLDDMILNPKSYKKWYQSKEGCAAN